MAVRRMISKSLIDTDMFLDLSVEAKNLYLFLNIYADDDGLIGSPKKVIRDAGATVNAMEELMKYGYLICFDTGVVAITHWLIHNYIRKDRYTPTLFVNEFNQLSVDENKQYILATDGRPNDNQRSTQVREGKEREDKVSIGESKTAEPSTPTPRGEFNNVILTEDEYERLKQRFPNCDKSIERLSQYMASTGKSYNSHYAVLTKWAEEDVSGCRTPQHNNMTKAASPERESSFDIDEFYRLAISQDIRSCLT